MRGYDGRLIIRRGPAAVRGKPGFHQRQRAPVGKGDHAVKGGGDGGRRLKDGGPVGRWA
jgi:hypothetical protein